MSCFNSLLFSVKRHLNISRVKVFSWSVEQVYLVALNSVHAAANIAGVPKDGNGWQVQDDSGYFFFLFLVSSTPSFKKPVTQIRTTVKEYITTQKRSWLFLFRDWTRKEKIYSSVLDCLPACFTNLNFRQLWTTLTALRWWEDGLNTFLVHTPVSRSVHNNN